MTTTEVRNLRGAPVIDLQDVNREFACGSAVVKALKNVTLQVYSGEYIAIVGPSGSGKTTLMNLIGCLDTPSSGRYSLDGSSVADLTDDAMSQVRNQKIGFVFQSFHLLPRSTALSNVALPLMYAGIRRSRRLELARRALEQVDLGDRMEHLPNQLSGGQRQRVAIARALVNQPALLLADEPTGALDQRTGHDIMNLFDRLNDRGTTMVVITHDSAVAARARRRLGIVDGQIASDEVLQ